MGEQGLAPWNRDTLVGVVGAALLIGAMAGIFLFERGQFETYEVTWSTEEGPSATESTTLQEGQEERLELAVSDAQAATLRVVVDWTDTEGDPDTFRLELVGPNGQRDTVEATQGPIELVLPAGSEPTVTTATGRSLEDARDQAIAAVNATAGQGTWTATLTLVSAPGDQTPVGDVETQGDGTNSFEMTMTQARWVPALTPQG